MKRKNDFNYDIHNKNKGTLSISKKYNEYNPYTVLYRNKTFKEKGVNSRFYFLDDSANCNEAVSAYTRVPSIYEDWLWLKQN